MDGGEGGDGVESQDVDGTSSGLSIALSPQGRLHVGAPGASTVAKRFERGDGHGLFCWVPQPDATLAPGDRVLARRGTAFVIELCAIPDLEGLRAGVKVEPPRGELARAGRRGAADGRRRVPDRARSEESLVAMGEAAARASSPPGRDGRGVPAPREPAVELVGRVYFHLAENKRDADAPFAFLATYTTRLSAPRRGPQHLPLGQALREYAGAATRRRCWRCSRRCSARADERRGDGAGRHAATSSTAGAGRRRGPSLSQDVPALEAAGRGRARPGWWRRRRPPRPEVQVTVGKATAVRGSAPTRCSTSGRGDARRRAAHRRGAARAPRGTDGLALCAASGSSSTARSSRQVLAHWEASSGARRGRPVVPRGHAPARRRRDRRPAARRIRRWRRPSGRRWSRARRWPRALAGLRAPTALRRPSSPATALRAELRPYQKVGVRWLWFLTRLGLGACLADDMGLGKTIQVLALLVAAQAAGRRRRARRSLLVVPASLLANWRAEIDALRARAARARRAPVGDARRRARASSPPS